jgi:hypothetical protein
MGGLSVATTTTTVSFSSISSSSFSVAFPGDEFNRVVFLLFVLRAVPGDLAAASLPPVGTPRAAAAATLRPFAAIYTTRRSCRIPRAPARHDVRGDHRGRRSGRWLGAWV